MTRKLLLAGHIQSCAVCRGPALVRRKTERPVACSWCWMMLDFPEERRADVADSAEQTARANS